MTQKIWFITGASRGFGREWAIAALERGDSVAATARDLSTLSDLREKYGERLLPLRLDVTDRHADFAAVQQAHERFGRLDVVVNNAGYGHFGMVEELTEAEARAQLETNLDLTNPVCVSTSKMRAYTLPQHFLSHLPLLLYYSFYYYYLYYFYQLYFFYFVIFSMGHDIWTPLL